MRSSRFAAMAVLGFALAACGGEQQAADPDPERDAAAQEVAVRSAHAPLRTADGQDAGSVTATEDAAGGIALSLSVTGMTPGQRGVHVHMVGLCEGPAFESAGLHWNPGNRVHGLEAEGGSHAGDMPNLTVGADGRGTLEYILQGGTFAQLLDADGSAFVVHAGADDQTTDPSGDSGDRVACGVFAERPATGA